MQLLTEPLGPILDFEPWRLLAMETPVPAGQRGGRMARHLVRFLRWNSIVAFMEKALLILIRRIFPGPGSHGVRHSVLSAVKEQRQKLMNSVSSNDRSRLEEYFTSLRDVEQKLAYELERPTPLPACSIPTIDDQEIGTMIAQVQNTHKQFATLLSHALACGQTRIFHVTLVTPFLHYVCLANQVLIMH